MSNIDLIIVAELAAGVLLLLVFVGALMALLHQLHLPKTDGKPKELTIGDLLDIAKNPKTSEDKLVKTAALFVKLFKFPKKELGKAPPEAEDFLQFIYHIAAHHNSSPRVIAQIDSDIKKNNKEYYEDIDRYERDGLAQHVKK